MEVYEREESSGVEGCGKSSKVTTNTYTAD